MYVCLEVKNGVCERKKRRKGGGGKYSLSVNEVCAYTYKRVRACA